MGSRNLAILGELLSASSIVASFLLLVYVSTLASHLTDPLTFSPLVPKNVGFDHVAAAVAAGFEKNGPLSDLPRQLALDVETEMLQSVFPSNLFETADILLNYDIHDFSSQLAAFSARISNALLDGAYTSESYKDLEYSNIFSAIYSEALIVASVQNLPNATRDVPIQDNWLGGIVTYLPNDLYEVMQDMNEWYQGFGDCQTLSGRFAVTPVWKGAFFDAFGYRHTWHCADCTEVFGDISSQCGYIKKAANASTVIH